MRALALFVVMAVLVAMIPFASAPPNCCRNGMSCPLAKMQHHRAANDNSCAVRCGMSSAVPAFVAIRPVAVIAGAIAAPHVTIARIGHPQPRNARATAHDTTPPVPPPRAA